MFRTGHLRPAMLGVALGVFGVSAAIAAPMTYQIDSAHTYPSFEVDHGGVSVWRGKFNSTSGTITMDKEAETGTVAITIDISSIDFGNQGLNDHVTGAQRPDPTMLDAAQFPTATYEGTLTDWVDGAPTAVEGMLTMHGVSQPVNLEIQKFVCGPGRGGETCGADAYAEFDRSDFGVTFGQGRFDMGVVLRIQVEAGSTQ
jgi:polyisoprenoid-binding protein YceI